MFGNQKIMTAAVRKSRGTRSTSVRASYFRFRAMDEALGGFLKQQGGPMVLSYVAEVQFRSRGMHHDTALAAGSYNLSLRQIAAAESNERCIVRGDDPTPTVRQGPPNGFSDDVRAEHARMKSWLESDDPIETIKSEHRAWKLHFWNTTGCPQDEQKGSDTVCSVEYVEMDDETAEMIRQMIEENLIEDIDGYTYKAPNGR